MVQCVNDESDFWQLLEVRIGTFCSTAKKMMNEEDGDRPYLENEVEQINSKWNSFHCQVGDTRKQIDLSIEYFTLVEEVEESFHEGSKLLVTIARKSTTVCTATVMYNDITYRKKNLS